MSEWKPDPNRIVPPREAARIAEGVANHIANGHGNISISMFTFGYLDVLLWNDNATEIENTLQYGIHTIEIKQLLNIEL
jgi:hypothetical protein